MFSVVTKPDFLRETAGGVVVAVVARAAGRRNAITGLIGSALKIQVTAAPEKGKANEAIIDVLASAFGCKRSQISLVSGATNPKKEFLMTGFSISQIAERYQEIAAAMGAKR